MFLHIALGFSLATSISTSQGVQPKSERGEFLVQQCRATTLAHPNPVEIEQGNMCMAYLEGFVDGRGYQYKDCMVGHSYTQLVAAYLSYMDKKPTYLKMSKRWGLDAALTTFCFTPKQN